MSNLTEVTYTGGSLDSSVSGTVSTVDKQLATIGSPTDAKSPSTDATSTTHTSILKQLSDYLGTLVTDAFGKGTAGTPSDDVITVQGHDSMTAIKTDGSATTQPVSNSALTNAGAGNYETIAASQTDQAMGATGATGDYFSHLTIIPGTTSPGAVSIKDGSGSSISVFAGGSSSVVSLQPFTVYLGAISTSGAWKVTTGANVTAIGFGKFT